MRLAYESRMRDQELLQYLKNGDPICIHLANVTAYSGYVRSVYLQRSFLGVDIYVEFEPHNYGEGGACFMANITTLPLAINILEQYLDIPFSRWQRVDPKKEYPKEPENFDLETGTSALVEAIKTNTVQLPLGRFALLGDRYWLQFVPK